MDEPKSSILVVDDEPFVLSSLAALLSKDFEVLTAPSAEAAQELLSRREIDMILTDQKMPGMSGVQLLEWVRTRYPRMVRFIMTGLTRVEDAIDAINCGQVSRYLCKPWRAEDLLQTLRSAARTYVLERKQEELLEELRRLNLELEERVERRTRELQEAYHQLRQNNQMLEKLALTDPLTELPNRRAMERLARMELRRRARFPNSTALGLVDVDYFKSINARYLLPGGDQVLCGLARVLVASLRTMDSVGRVGGEEFEIVAPETCHEGAVILAERVRQAVESSIFRYQETTIRITASIGFAVADSSIPVEYEQLRHVAAAALEEAKCTGRNRCVVRGVENSSLHRAG